MQGPNILFIDIETAPILAQVWKIWDENIALNQIRSDWFILSWAAKWAHESKVMYQDQRKSKNLENDKPLLESAWELLNSADIVVTQNGRNFDIKKLNSRFVINGMKPPAPFKQIDTLQIAKRHFGFTSNKLEYLSDKICKKYKKLKHEKFSGFEMWKECLSGNQEAWREMEKYNRYDVLALEELYTKLIPWDSTINFDVYRETEDMRCTCGSDKLQCRGYSFTTAGKYQRFQCQSCGCWTKGRTNLFSKEKKKSLRSGILS